MTARDRIARAIWLSVYGRPYPADADAIPDHVRAIWQDLAYQHADAAIAAMQDQEAGR